MAQEIEGFLPRFPDHAERLRKIWKIRRIEYAWCWIWTGIAMYAGGLMWVVLLVYPHNEWWPAIGIVFGLNMFIHWVKHWAVY